MSIQYLVNLEAMGRAYPHYWELSVGSCHASTILREDVRAQIRRAHEECGFQYLRFHGLFDDDMSVVIEPMMPFEEPRISFFNIDSIFDFLLESGMKPFVELGFMPGFYASGTQTCFHYKGNVTMPKDDSTWIAFIRKFTEHLLERYGEEEVSSWYFEVWNEPNLNFFFDGTQEDYFHLYQITVETMKSVNMSLRVGGPSTSNNMWILEFKKFCLVNQVPLDFITTHHYPKDDPLSRKGMNGPGTKGKGIDEETVASLKNLPKEEQMKIFDSYFSSGKENPRDILYQLTVKAKKEAGEYPLIYTEWNGSDEYDTCYQAAFILQTLAYNENLVEGYSYWTVSDIFEEMGLAGLPFHNEFGLQTVYGIKKPSYRIFQELHRAGTRRLPVEGTSHRTAEILALAGENETMIFVYNHDIVRRNVQPQEITLTISGFYRQIERAIIDENHCNPCHIWEQQGKPEYPTKAQLKEQEEASRLVYETVEINEGNLITLNFTAQPESITIFKIK